MGKQHKWRYDPVMPYHCEQRGGKWACVGPDGDTMSRHDTKGQCEAAAAAKYDNEKKSKKKSKKSSDGDSGPPYGNAKVPKWLA